MGGRKDYEFTQRYGLTRSQATQLRVTSEWVAAHAYGIEFTMQEAAGVAWVLALMGKTASAADRILSPGHHDKNERCGDG